MTDTPPHGSAHEPGEDARLLSEKLQELTRLIRNTRLDSAAPQNQAPRGQESAARKLRAHTRLSALARLLAPLYSELPELHGSAGRADAFAFALVPGTPPRYWVDLKSFILMAPDGDTYRFVRAIPQMQGALDGPRDLLESQNINEVVDWVADYVTEVLTGAQAPEHRDASPTKTPREPESAVRPEKQASARNAAPKHLEPQQPIVIQAAPPSTDWAKIILALALGIVLGAAGLFTLAWFQTPSIG